MFRQGGLSLSSLKWVLITILPPLIYRRWEAITPPFLNDFHLLWGLFPFSLSLVTPRPSSLPLIYALGRSGLCPEPNRINYRSLVLNWNDLICNRSVQSGLNCPIHYIPIPEDWLGEVADKIGKTARSVAIIFVYCLVLVKNRSAKLITRSRERGATYGGYCTIRRRLKVIA